jgi:1,4-alpha-glucan branching enzyme
MQKILLFILTLLPSLLVAQVTTEPNPVRDNDEVTIYYDATQGTSGLQGASKVYMHAGAVTESSNGAWKYVVGNWGQDDGIGQMTKVEGEADLWKITLTPNVREYFSVPENEKITQIGMVFRNAAGTAEGKSDENGDIFVPVLDGYDILLNSPASFTVLADAGEEIVIDATASETSDFILYYNGNQLTSQSASTEFTYTFLYNGEGIGNILRLEATNGSETVTREITVNTRVYSPTATIPGGLQNGLNQNSASSATFVLTAPGKNSVFLVADFTNWEIQEEYLMKRDGEKFWLEVEELSAGGHSYYYLVDQEIEIIDPYSEIVLDTYNDRNIPAGNYPNRPPFPAAAQTDWLTYFDLGEEEYQWNDQDYVRPENEDLIIYELLVRDFDATSSYQGVIDRLDYLDSLNINAIQLMPIMEFSNNDSWGYNPYAQTALDKYYGSRAKFKELVDKAHQRGMAVILDIALNHQDFPAPYIKLWGQGFGATADNPYFYERAQHPFNVFVDANHNSEYTQEWVDQVNRYWIEEFHVDGYRFDLSKGFTTEDYGDNVGAWGRKSEGRIALLNRMADKIWEVDPTAYVILEHFADNAEEQELANDGMMLWGNLNHNYSEAIMGYNITSGASSFNGISYKARSWNEPHLVGYMESHDEERLIYKSLTFGNSAGDYSTKELNTALNREEAAAVMFIPVPGPKMIWQFGEFGYDISINACPDGTVPDPNGPEPNRCRTARKPLRWEYLNDKNRQDLFRLYSELNYLKTTYPVFGTSDYTFNGSGEVRTLYLNGSDMNVVAVANFALTPKTATVNFQHSGTWNAYFKQESISVSNTQHSLTLAPGEYRFFTDQPIFYRGDRSPLGLENTELATAIGLYPNPSSNTINLTLPDNLNAVNKTVKVRDVVGKLVPVRQEVNSNQIKLGISELKPGMYFIEIEAKGSKAVKRIIKK